LVTKGEFTPVLKNSKAAAFDHKAQKVRLGGHRIFQPLPTDPLDFESTIEGSGDRNVGVSGLKD